MAQSLGRAIDGRFSQNACVASLSDYDASTIAEIDRDSLVIFILSTFGEGDPPDNAYDFAHWLRSGLSASTLTGLRFAILGIGSSNYKWYNQFSLTTFDHLRKADADPIMDLYLADDAQSLTDEGYFSWSTKLFDCFVSKLGMPEQIRPYEPSLDVQSTNDSIPLDSIYTPRQLDTSLTNRSKGPFPSPIRPLPILDARKLTESPARPFFHLDIDISSHPDIKYLTGDHIAIWPENEEAEIELLCLQLGIPPQSVYDPLRILKVKPAALWNPAGSDVITLDALFKIHLDIAAAVSRELIQDLKEFAPTPAAKDFLQSVSASKKDYTRYRSSDRITFASVLRDASPDKAWQIPVSFLLERIPPMKPRYYSIASASSVHPRKVSITVSLNTVALESPNQVHRGLASHYLYSKSMTSLNNSHVAPGTSSDAEPTRQSLLPLHNIWCSLQKSKFRLPANLRRPIVMIATGSGIAPFRAYVQHAVKQDKLGHDVAQLVLYFGCRSPEEHLYKDELESSQVQLGAKLQITAVYSRSGAKPRHVQDAICDSIDHLSRLLLEQEASMYICGSTAMARDVNQGLSEGLCRTRSWTAEQFASFESDAKRSRRWQEDVWG